MGNWFVWEPYRQGTYGHKGEERSGGVLRGSEFTCAFCKGVGQRPRGSKCSVCRGSCVVKVTPPVVRCAHCEGRGEERPRTNITCTACKGTGYISIVEPVTQCPECRGTGKEIHSKLPCIKCKGSGVIRCL